MSMDDVEIIMESEDAFGLTFTETELVEMDTVGKFVKLIHSKLRQSEDDPCLSMRAFYELRKELSKQLKIDKRSIKPDSQLRDIFDDNYREQWQQLCKALNTLPVDLKLPIGLDNLIYKQIPIGIFFISIVLFFMISPFIIWLSFFTALLSIIIGVLLTQKKRTELPHDKIRDLIPYLSSTNTDTWSEQDVFEKVREIAVEILAVKPEDVKMESTWIYDLGMN